MTRPDTEDRLATDPHGFPPVPPPADTELPRQRAPRPVHEAWDPAHQAWDPAPVPDPRRPTAVPDDVYADDRYADPGYVDDRYAEPYHVDDRYAEPYHVDDRYAEPYHVDDRYAEPYHVDERHVDDRYADERYAEPHFADDRYPEPYDVDERYVDERYAEPHHADDRYADERYAEDPSARHSGDLAVLHTSAEPPAGRRARRRAREEGEPLRTRRVQPPRPPRADTLVRHPDEMEREAGGLRFTTVAIPVAIGSLVAVGIGAWARSSDATGVAVNIAGFSSAGAVKTWLATAALVFALVQLWTAMVMRGRIGSGPGARTATVHRWSGRIAVLITVPVAVQCLIAMGWSDATPRTLAHSLLGCVFYGAFVAKMLLLRGRGVPGWLIAVAGGLLLAVLAGIWLTSALWFFGTKGLTF